MHLRWAPARTCLWHKAPVHPLQLKLGDLLGRTSALYTDEFLRACLCMDMGSAGGLLSPSPRTLVVVSFAVSVCAVCRGRGSLVIPIHVVV
jgi:hypothetical protein